MKPVTSTRRCVAALPLKMLILPRLPMGTTTDAALGSPFSKVIVGTLRGRVCPFGHSVTKPGAAGVALVLPTSVRLSTTAVAAPAGRLMLLFGTARSVVVLAASTGFVYDGPRL